MEEANQRRFKKWWKIPLLFGVSIILILLVAFGFYVIEIFKQIKSGEYQTIQMLNSIPQNTNPELQKLLENSNSYWIGSPKPKITIVEFLDFSCPSCRNLFPKIREISLKHDKYVKIIIRDYPVFENSIETAMAARCAGEQGLFWLMHDKLFQNNPTEKNDLIIYANQIGADSAKFKECLMSNKYLSDIRKDFSDAEALGVAGTPTLFINGVKLEGDVPLEILNKIIEEFLKNNL